MGSFLMDKNKKQWYFNLEMKNHHQSLKQICEQFGLLTLYAFGSQAKKIKNLVEGHKDALPLSSSDVDIGVRVLSVGKFSVTEKVNLALALEDLFGCKRVDLISLSEADPFLAAEVIRGERLFAHNEYEADEYELYVLRRAGDLAPLERERMVLVLGEST
jgi:predicted nucleotidyltransferase